MSQPTLDEQIAAAGAALATAQTFMDRHDAGRTLDALNAQKLGDLMARTNPATGVIETEPVTPTIVAARRADGS